MKILAMDRTLPGVTFVQIKPLLKSEAEHAWQNYEKGIFREMYLRENGSGAVVILECGNIEEAKGIMAELPLVKAKLIKFDFTSLEPFTPFALLFNK